MQINRTTAPSTIDGQHKCWRYYPNRHSHGRRWCRRREQREQAKEPSKDSNNGEDDQGNRTTPVAWSAWTNRNILDKFSLIFLPLGTCRLLLLIFCV